MKSWIKQTIAVIVAVTLFVTVIQYVIPSLFEPLEMRSTLQNNILVEQQEVVSFVKLTNTKKIPISANVTIRTENLEKILYFDVKPRTSETEAFVASTIGLRGAQTLNTTLRYRYEDKEKSIRFSQNYEVIPRD